MAPSFVHAATLALRAAAAICPASPTCPQDDQCSSTLNGVTLQVSCASDFYGGDLELAQTSTLSACMNACSSTNGCVAASYVGGNCYMKSKLNAASENANVIGIAVTARTTVTPVPTSPGQVCPASFTCPENDGCSFPSGSRTLTLACGKDFYGGDIGNVYAESYQACTNACATDSDCVAASYVGGKGNGRCYLKGTKNGATDNDGVDAVYVNVPSVQSSSVVASSSAAPRSSSASVASSSAVISSSVVSSIASSTPSIVSSSTTLSSSTVVSSTSTSSTPVATPSNLGVCDNVNSGTNLVQNPSFESASDFWTLVGNSYPSSYLLSAHCGTFSMVIGPYSRFPTSGITQKISTALDVTRSYAVTFNYAPGSSNGAATCILELFANDDQIFTHPVVFYGGGGFNYQKFTPQFTPKSPDVTLNIQLACVGANANWGGSYIFVDDVTLAPV